MSNTESGYDIILADPPWRYRAYKKGGHGKARDHYADMSLKDVCKLEVLGQRVKDITASNAALFLWCVWPMIFEARLVMRAWGFTYKTIGFLWAKSSRKITPESFVPAIMEKWHIGMGAYTRSNTEPCLLAIKGSMPVDDHSIRSLMIAPPTKHSSKPPVQYTAIESLYPNRRYLELFARERRSGWEAWGNEL